ncbi:RecQ family ATP-dependent DNA helicase [Jonesia quinghaiensis]|uniref:RecQ family ATP-dependent DNA helicase n=1 Tax=Jonesia quinghaiensis TaxID=262806 RepID=UPI00041B86EE|nr:RecQ family ATP-dependent DNA helicase [Jonesia quinghaiensis]
MTLSPDAASAPQPDDTSEHVSAEETPQETAILGPVAAKGPKRFPSMPDMDKLARLAQERTTPRPVVESAAWGVSSVDARALATQDTPSHADTSTVAARGPVGTEIPLDVSVVEDTPISVSGSAVNETVEDAVVASEAADALGERAQEVLRQLTGRQDAEFRADQWEAIERLVVDAQRVLVVQRTGWGKSAVYFVATALLREQGNGPTVIISPLLALMRDQIRAAEGAGLRAVTMNSSNSHDWSDIEESIANGEVDVLLISPERLNNPQFVETVLPQLADVAGLLVIDEAHCISDWGHDFRPDYRRIKDLLTQLPENTPVLATTATANERVTVDVAAQLGAHHNGEVTVLRGSLERESLHLAVVTLPNTAERIAWVIDALSSFQGSGIIYTLTVAAASELTKYLSDAGIPVAAYSGQTPTEEREHLENQLRNNELKALVATSALGMGFDKPDLRFVIHFGSPDSPVGYYQHVGRAGRGVDKASAILLAAAEDRKIWDYFASLSFPDEDTVRTVLDVLNNDTTNDTALSLAALEARTEIKRSRLELMLKVLDVDGAVARVRGGWRGTGEPWEYDKERYERIKAARDSEQRHMVDYLTTSQCRSTYLRLRLDDPTVSAQDRCGRCDNCGAMSLPTRARDETRAAVTDTSTTSGIVIEPRKMWPHGLSDHPIAVSGKIPEAQRAQPGRAVARTDALTWATTLRDMIDGPDQEMPIPLRHAAVAVISEWGIGQHIDGVVAIRSATRPQLTYHLATGLAKYLGKPLVGTFGPRTPEPDRHDVNSATRLTSVNARIRSELDDAVLAQLPGKKVLLVDDYTQSGWTLAIVAQALTQHGAAAVYPFVLAHHG